MFRKNLCCIFVFVLLMNILVGCSNQAKISVYDTDAVVESIMTQSVAENDKYTLLWNDEAKCVLLQNKQTEKYWSTIPYEYLLQGGSSNSLNSPINLQVYDTKKLQIEDVSGYAEAVESGRVFSEKSTDGITVTYCFDEYKISIPVVYVLQDEGLAISVDGNSIVEGSDEFYLLSISIAPYLCSAINNDSSSYLFIPSGSGALMYATETSDKNRTFSGEVYGEDLSRVLQMKPTEEVAIRLPVFGVKDGNEALLGIIEEDSISAEINAEAGNNRTGYSHVWPKFYFRGYDIIAPTTNTVGASDITRISDERSYGSVKVLFYPLSGEDASYVGMANSYRNYLQSNNLLKKTNEKQQMYGISLLGALPVTDSFLGIPYQKISSLTTFDDAKQIVTELKENTGFAPTVRLQGFGENGVFPGKIAGGYKFSASVGSASDRKKFDEFCSQNAIKLFYDFDLVRYSNSGFNVSAAKTAISKKSEGYFLSAALRSFDEDFSYNILKRDLLAGATDKLITMLSKEKVDGVSLSSLSSFAYSDFTNERTFVKGEMASDVRKYIQKIGDQGHIIASSDANSYAASMSDIIFDIPVNNGNYYVFDEQVPFYQMVFKGIRPLYSESINLDAEPEKQVMKAISSGTALSFTLIYDYESTYATIDKYGLYGMVYDGQKQLIQEIVAKYATIYEKVANSFITDYKNLSDNVSMTIFDNDVILYVNHANENVDCPIGILKPYEAKIVN